MSNAADFSVIVDIARTGAKVPWDMGDALGDLCGPPGAHGRRDGSREKIRSAIDAIVNTLGFCDYDDSTLARYRIVAREFPKEIRRHDLAWSVHREAGTKERLAAAIARCPPGARLTRDLIRQALHEIDADAQREREAAYEATRLASRKILDEEVRAEKAVLVAQTEEELAIADQQFVVAHRQAEIVRAQLAKPPKATAKALRAAKAPSVKSPVQVKQPTAPPVDNAVLQNAQRHISQQDELRQAQGKLDAWNSGGGDDVLSSPAASIPVLANMIIKMGTREFWAGVCEDWERIQELVDKLQSALGIVKLLTQ
jgi:hypothetical protein